MKKLLVCCLALIACAPSATSVIPPSTGDGPRPDLVLVWSGHGEAERLEGGTWNRIPSFVRAPPLRGRSHPLDEVKGRAARHA